MYKIYKMYVYICMCVCIHFKYINFIYTYIYIYIYTYSKYKYTKCTKIRSLIVKKHHKINDRLYGFSNDMFNLLR